MLPTVAVTVTLRAEDGIPYEGVTVRAHLDKNDRYQGFVVAGDVTGITDAAGTATLDLFPNHPTTGLGTTGSIYHFTASIPHGKSLNEYAQVPNSDCSLDSIAAIKPAAGLSDAQAAAASAAASAAAASGSATEAAMHAADAADSAAAAADSAADAGAAAGGVADDAADAEAAAIAAQMAAVAADASADLAEASAQMALASETNAAGSADEAETAAQVATNKAGEAVTSADEASDSAAAADMSATQAGNSATSAMGSAANASTSATAAGNSATAAATSATNASTSAGQAATSATNAANSAAAAAGSASSTAGSVAAAAASASAAATSATQAADSATAAAGSATSAAGSATSAGNAATAAQGSAAAAAGSASQAATSAGQAAGSASNAANSAAIASAAVSNALTIYGGTVAISGAVNSANTAAQVATAQANLSKTYAQQSASAVQQDLSGVQAAALHRSPNPITSLFVYDTHFDSDGGAWIERMQNTSWYNEPLNGPWIAEGLSGIPSELVARALGGTLGAELITNGTFTTDTAGWTPAASATIAAVNSELQLTAGGVAFPSATQTLTLTVGQPYLVGVKGRLGTSAQQAQLALPGGSALVFQTTSNQTAYGVLVPVATSNTFTARINATPAAGQTVYFDDISVKAITAFAPAGSYYQLSTDGKFYKLNKNLLKFSDTFSNAAWSKGGTGTATAAAAPDGTGETLSVGVGGNGVYQNISGLISGQRYEPQVKVWPITTVGTLKFENPNGAANGAWAINLALLTAGQWNTITRAHPAVTVTTEFAPSAGNGGVHFYTGTGTVSFYSKNAQFEVGTASTTYEPKGADGTQTEVFRGNKAKFPRLAGVVAEATSLTIYDFDEPGRPMWMRFAVPGNYQYLQSLWIGVSIVTTYLMQGQLCVGFGDGLAVIDFCKDGCIVYPRNSVGFTRIINMKPVALRNDNTNKLLLSSPAGTVALLGVANAVAMTVLPDAPVDAATGLQVPTIVVGTGGGTVVIRPDGTMVSDVTNTLTLGISDDQDRVLLCSASNSGSYLMYTTAGLAGMTSIVWIILRVSNNIESNFAGGNMYKFAKTKRGAIAGSSNIAAQVIGFASRFVGAAPASATIKPMVFRIESTFNTGWMLGDIRRCWMADVAQGVISGANIFPAADGRFDADSGYWTKEIGTSISGGKANYAAAANNFAVYRPGQTVPSSRLYFVTFTIDSISAGGVRPYLQGSFGATRTAPGTYSEVLLAGLSGNTSLMATGASTTATLDDFVLSELVEDRSAKNKPLTIFGTLSKNPVATGAQLVAYSGWSASNYLQEPYSADLDFSIGAWRVGAGGVNSTNVPLGGNLLAYTEDFTNAAWTTKINPVYGVTDALGGTKAITVTSSAPGQIVLRQGNIPAPANLLMVNSVYIRRRTGTGTINLATPGNNTFDATALVDAGAGAFVRVSTIAQGLTGSGLTNTYFYVLLGTTGDSVDVCFPQTEVGNLMTVYKAALTTPLYVTGPIAERRAAAGPYIVFGMNSLGQLTVTAYDGTTTRTVTTTVAYNFGTFISAHANYTPNGAASTLTIEVNGVTVATSGSIAALSSMDSRWNKLTYSEDFGNAAWIFDTYVGTKTLGQTDPLGGTTAARIAANLGTPAYFSRGGTGIGLTGQVFQATTSLWIKWVSGATTINMRDAANVSAPLTITNAWVRYSMPPAVALSGVLYFTIDIPMGTTIDVAFAQWNIGALMPYQRVAAATDFDNPAVTTVGNSRTLDAPFPGSIALAKMTATVPTAEQAAFMYEQEKRMFRDGAQVAFPDGGVITGTAYDDVTDTWYAVNTNGGVSFQGLCRTGIVTSPGSYTNIAARSGARMESRTAVLPGVDITLPSQNLKEELLRRGEDAARNQRGDEVYDRVGVTSQTDFVIPAGMETRTVYVAGVLKQEGSTKDWTRLYDGFKETIRFAVAPAAGAWVQIQARRTP